MGFVHSKINCLSPITRNETTLVTNDINAIPLTTAAVISIFVLVTNLLLIIGFYKKRRPFSVTTRLFIALSIVGMVKACQFAVTVSESTGVFTNNCQQYFGLLAFNHFVFSLDIIIYCTISILRYFSIRDPLGGNRLCRRKLKWILLVEFLFCALHGVVMFFVYQEFKAQFIERFTIGITVFFILLLVFVLSVNLLSYKHINRPNRMLETESKKEAVGTDDEFSKIAGAKMKKKRHSLKTLIIITSLYWICYLPFTVLMVLQSSPYQIHPTDQPLVYFALVSLSVVNVGFNSLVIILRTRSIRECFSVKFCCR